MNPSSLFLQRTTCLLVLVFTPMAVAAEPSTTCDAMILRPWIGETTLVIAKFDPTRLPLPNLTPTQNESESAAEQPHKQWPLISEAIEAFQATMDGHPIYLSFGTPKVRTERPDLRRPQFQIVWPTLLFLQESPDVDKQRLQAYLRSCGIELTSMVLRTVNDESMDGKGMIVMAPDGIIDLSAKKLDIFAGSPPDGLDDAFASVAAYPIQILLLPPDYIRRTVVELMPQLPRHLGGGSSDVLTEGLRWAALGLDPAQLRTTLIVRSASPAAAQRLADRLPVMLQSIYREVPGLQQHVDRKTFETLASLFQPVVQDDRIVFRIGEDQPLPTHLQVLVAAMIDSIEDRLRGQDGSERVTGAVSGRVTLDGQPLAKGRLVLHPPDGRPIEIEITDGAFAAKDVPIAEMRVVIQGEGVPESFARKETTALVVQTLAEANVFNLELRRED